MHGWWLAAKQWFPMALEWFYFVLFSWSDRSLCDLESISTKVVLLDFIWLPFQILLIILLYVWCMCECERKSRGICVLHAHIIIYTAKLFTKPHNKNNSGCWFSLDFYEEWCEVVTVINFNNFKSSSALLHNSMKIANYEI